MVKKGSKKHFSSFFFSFFTLPELLGDALFLIFLFPSISDWFEFWWDTRGEKRKRKRERTVSVSILFQFCFHFHFHFHFCFLSETKRSARPPINAASRERRVRRRIPGTTKWHLDQNFEIKTKKRMTGQKIKHRQIVFAKWKDFLEQTQQVQKW